MTKCVASAKRKAFWSFQLSFQLYSISASVQVDNVASTKPLQAIGFISVGVMREVFCVDGRFIDRGVFDLLESDLKGEF